MKERKEDLFSYDAEGEDTCLRLHTRRLHEGLVAGISCHDIRRSEGVYGLPQSASFASHTSQVDAGQRTLPMRKWSFL